MRPGPVVVVEVFAQDLYQVALAQDGYQQPGQRINGCEEHERAR